MIEKLKRLWEHWLRIAKVIGDFQASVILTIFYIVIFGPMAICFRLFSDALHLKKPSSVTWSARVSVDPNLDAARKQF